MMNPEDRQVADEAIAELKRLQSCNIEVVMEGLKRLGDQVGPQEKTDDGKERHDAWIAICTLLHSLKGNPSAPVDHLWQKALGKTCTWRAAFDQTPDPGEPITVPD